MLPFIDIPFRWAARWAGASPDELKLVFSFFLSYPLSAVLKRLPADQPWRKNAFVIAVAVFYLIGLFDLWAGVRTLFLSSAAAYIIAARIRSPYMPWIAFIVIMCHLSVNQIDRQRLNDSSVVDITGAQMVLVMKLTSFCWNVHDGRLKEADLADYQKSHAIRELPSLLDFAGFVLYFPALFAGPSFDYADYQRWVYGSMFDSPSTVGTAPAANRQTRRKIPSSLVPALSKALQGIVWILLYLKFGPMYGASTVLGDDFVRYGFLRRVWRLEMLGLTSRFKYYGVWSLAEGACILSGLSYNGTDPRTGRVRWDRLRNVNPWGIESAQNSRAYLENWNMNTNSWLRNCVYLRVTPKGKKPGFRASLATFVTSAVWHGFYPGYYLTFVLAAFIQTVAKNFRRYVRPFFLTRDGQRPTEWKFVYDIASYLATQSVFCFTTLPFVVLTLSDTLKVWARVYFYAVIAVGISTAFFASPAKAYLVRRLRERQGTTEQAARPVKANEALAQPLLGLPSDLERDVNEALAELRSEIESRRRRGSLVNMPEGDTLRREIEKRLGKSR